MHITEKLIERFLANGCSAEEAAAVADYLVQHPEVLKAYLKKAWDEAETKGAISHAYSHQMLETVKSELFSQKRSLIRRIKWIGIAACFLLAAGAWWVWNNKPTQVVVESRIAAGKATATPDKWETRQNGTQQSMKVTLADGSVVTLSPGASIRYDQSFNDVKRDIYLQGDAIFKVAKDKEKPFTVHAGFFSTTALGTVFRVNANVDMYSVKLFEGKVVIKALQENIGGWHGPVFLEPGQEMQYDALRSAWSVKRFNEEKSMARIKPKELPANENEELTFRNAPLKEVFAQLEKRYDRRINYSNIEIDDMYFSGSVLKNDSLETILQVIAQMNALTIAEAANGFIVRKSQ
jgi:transmembrane sensor